jgi:hydrogenase nickel incorporation protein HypA/HybF
MHELSIAMSLVDAACEEADRLGNVRVAALHLRLGPLSGVVKDALEFSFDLATEGTVIAGARLEVEETAVIVFCPDCRAERELPGLQSFRCPVCGGESADVVGGRDLELVSMEVLDAEGSDEPLEMIDEIEAMDGREVSEDAAAYR